MDPKNTPDIYGAVVQFVIHAENISWNRFNNFLLAASVLVIAWATLYSQASDSCGSRVIQSLICLLGILCGIAWAFLGARSRDYLDKYIDQGSEMEKGYDKSAIKLFPDPPGTRPNQFIYSSSRFLLTAVPIAFVVLYLAMLFVTLLKSGAPCCA